MAIHPRAIHPHLSEFIGTLAAAVRHLALAVCMASVIGAPGAAAQAWKPERSVELVVFAAAGGGNDKAARVIQKIWTENRMLEAVVVNKVGGGGSLAYTYVSQKPDSHVIAIAQAGLLTNQITGRSPLGLTDVTVLPYIGTEPVGLAVKTESPYKNLREFMDQLKKKPASLSVSVGSTLGAINHFTIALLAKSAGVDPKKLKILVFGGGAESATNLLGGHIDAMAQATNNAVPFYQAGKMRILGVSTAKRTASLPDVPTFREQGYNVVIDGWYVFVGPKNMTPAQVAYWDAIFAKTTQTAEWKKFVETTGWEPGYKNSQETAAYLRKEYDEAKAILTELGLAK